MKSMILLSAIVFSATMASAQEMSLIRTSGEIEASCRIKAKEIAAETYRGCVTDQKNSQIEQIKKEYAAKLQALKSHYDQELKKMSGKAKAEESAPEQAAPIPVEKSEKTDSVSNKPASKKQKNASSSPTSSAKKVAKKSSAPSLPAPVAKSEVSEMTVQLKPAPGTPSMDESTMDLPEPIPMEEAPISESSI